MWKKAILVLLLALVATPASAQRRGLRDRVRERVKVLRVTRVIEALNLDEKTATRLMPIVNRAYDDIGDVARDSGEARRELRRLLDSGASEPAQLNPLIDRMAANKARIDQLEQDMFRDVRKVLSAAQVGRLVLVLPEINRQINQQIRRAAKGGAPDDGDNEP